MRNLRIYSGILSFLLVCLSLPCWAAGSGIAIGGDGRPAILDVGLARANYDAWRDILGIPHWQDARGGISAWHEMGPFAITNGWGGAMNAGRMTCLAIDPIDDQVIYAGAASGGIWRSVDRGESWKPLADFEPSLSYGAIAIDPFDHREIFAGMGESNNSLDSFQGAGIMRSMDGGESWQLLSNRVFLGERFSRIVFSPTTPGELFVATSRGVLRSIDGGGTWVQLLSGDATDLALNPRSPNEMLAAIGLFRGSPLNGLYRSTDGGVSWKKLSRDLPYAGTQLGRLQFGQCADYPNVIYAAMYSNGTGLLGLMKSENFGKSWIRMPNAPSYAGGSAWYYNVVAVEPDNPNVVFLCGTTTYRSEDGGMSFIDCTRSYGDGNVHPDHHAITFDPLHPHTLYLCTDGGIFRSSDLGESWKACNHDLATVQFQFLDVDPSNPMIAYGGTQDNGTLKDIGKRDWPNVEAGDGGVTRVDPFDPKVVYGEYVGMQMYKSVDSGKTWDWGITKGIDRKGALFYSPFNLDPENGNTLVAGGLNVYRTTNAAASWKKISPLLGGAVSAVTIAPNNSKVIYAGTSLGNVWVTPDTGKNWFNITKGLPKAYIGDIEVDPRNARVVYVCLKTWTSQSVWKSVDAGGTWENISDDLPPLPSEMIALDPSDPDRLFLATDVGVFISDHGGGKWLRYGSGLPNAPIFSVVANRKTGLLTVGTHGRGAWNIPLP